MRLHVMGVCLFLIAMASCAWAAEVHKIDTIEAFEAQVVRRLSALLVVTHAHMPMPACVDSAT
jgi:hypothetical protein